MAANADFNREKTHWSTYEAQVLLTLWADASTQQELESTVRNERVYSRIASELAAVGIRRSVKQCREKIKKLKQQYKKLKDENRKTDAEWYVTMDSVLGRRDGTNFECDVMYCSPDNTVENNALTTEAQFGSDQAFFGTLPSARNGRKRTHNVSAMKNWANQRRRLLLKAKQTARRRHAFQGRDCPNLAVPAPWGSSGSTESHPLPGREPNEMEIPRQSSGAGLYEENTEEEQRTIKIETRESYDGQQRRGLTGDEPIVAVQILDEEQQPVIQEIPEGRPTSHTSVSRTNQAVKRKREPCLNNEWKKMMVESDQAYLGALNRMLQSESQQRREELEMKREEMELKRTDMQAMRDEFAASSAVQGQLVSILGQIAQLFKTSQAKSHTRVLQDGPGQSSDASLVGSRAGEAFDVLFARAQSDIGAPARQTVQTESHEENHPTETRSIVKIEAEEPFDVQQSTREAPINLETTPTQSEKSQASSTRAALTALQLDLLAAQREQCRLMAENNSIQRTLVKAVCHGNRCMSELTRSIRAQTGVTTSIQDRIVQLQERQEWTNQLLTMKLMGVSSASSKGGCSSPRAGVSSACQSLFPGQENSQ
ncbi:hypothetical protein GJAV_G00164230 [Gymnothorax javanicus]|nr:hypothetical protein GJAV_G00164230 [Gymnothorax javanicus]